MGAIGMSHTGQIKGVGKVVDPRERELIVAYLSYALEDVRAVSAAGLQLLQLTIAAITEESAAQNPIAGAPMTPTACH